MSCNICENEICQGIEPSKICLTVPRDADSTLTFVLTDDDGNTVDLTTDKVRFTVKDKIGGAVKLDYTNPAGAHLDPINGKTRFTIGHAAIAAVALPADESQSWVYEVRRTQTDDKEAIHIQGDFVVKSTVGGP